MAIVTTQVVHAAFVFTTALCYSVVPRVLGATDLGGVEREVASGGTEGKVVCVQRLYVYVYVYVS